MTRHQLFTRLCAITDSVQAELCRLEPSPHLLALVAVVSQLDGLIDEITDAPLVEPGREGCQLCAYLTPSAS